MGESKPPLGERLGLAQKWLDYQSWETVLATAVKIAPTANDYDRAWAKCDLPLSRWLLSLACLYAGKTEVAEDHGRKCLDESIEFLFGDWRGTYNTPDGKADSQWWKRHFIWMQIFEICLFWGSVLGEWELLKKIGSFPEPDSCISDGRIGQERDLYVALGRFLSANSDEKLEISLKRVESGPNVFCNHIAGIVRAAQKRDARFDRRLTEYLSYYRKTEFPKDDISAKISIHGTLFVNWARKEGLNTMVPFEFSKYIVEACGQ